MIISDYIGSIFGSSLRILAAFPYMYWSKYDNDKIRNWKGMMTDKNEKIVCCLRRKI